MKIDVVEPDPIPVDVVLTLSAEEAGILMAVVGKVGGWNETIRKVTDEIFYSLDALDVKELKETYTQSTGKIKTGTVVFE